MKKKILSILITIFAIFTCMFTLTACAGMEFKVNFVVDGQVYSTLNTNGEEIIKMPENPTKDNYTFDGWYWDKDTWQTPFTANSLLDAPLSSDMNVYAKWKANVIKVESVTLNKTEITLYENDVEYLTATILPANATDTSVLWESSNPTIATVVGGKVTALRVGSVTISAITNDGGKIATCNVYVEPVLVESVSLNYTSLSLLNGESKTLTATVLPNNATEKGVLWQSSNSSIVSVENGTITAVGYGTATITVTTIDGNKTATCQVEIIEDKITFNTLSVDGETVYGKVSNSTTTFSFIREVVEHGNATYKVFKEITCENEIYSKSISLNAGDNTVYILQTVGKDIQLYTVTIRRRSMYEIVFNTNGGTIVEKQVVEEDFYASEPITTRIGYTFDDWDYDFSKPITSNKTITASWTANKNTPYKVEYYLENLEDDNYTLTQTVNKTGTTDTTANAEIKAFLGFEAETQSVSGNINGNGKQVLKVYYQRQEYNVTFNTNGGSLVSGSLKQKIKHGGSAIAPIVKFGGLSLEKWDKSFENVIGDIELSAEWQLYTKDGNYIYFGFYPQTIKNNSVVVSSEVNSNGYYTGSDNAYYAKVVAKPYGSGYRFSNSSSVAYDTFYYFKVEPIKWRILSEENGTVFLLCDSIIEKHRFDSNSTNYAESEIRTWLNETFYSTAFTELHQTLINTTKIDNEVTEDKVFLLSHKEATNSEYGLNLRMQTSDYARAMGIRMLCENDNYGNGCWWLSSPGYSASGNGIQYVHFYGFICGDVSHYASTTNGIQTSNFASITNYGVVPALKISLY